MPFPVKLQIVDLLNVHPSRKLGADLFKILAGLRQFVRREAFHQRNRPRVWRNALAFHGEQLGCSGRTAEPGDCDGVT